VSKAVFFTEDHNLHKLFSACVRRNIALENVKRAKNGTYFTVKCKDAVKVLEISKEMCYTIDRVGTLGFLRMLLFFKKRWSVVLALTLAVGIAFAFQSRIASVTVVGEVACKEEVQSVLREHGITVGRLRYGLDLQKVCDEVEGLDGVARVIATRQGARLCFAVFPETLSPEPSEVQKGGRIVAQFDGIVTKIAVVAGTCLVKVGDVVTRGDVLIEGKDPLDESLTVVPKGTVYGQVWSVAQEDFFSEREVEYRTGRSVARSCLCWNGREVLKDRRKIPYESFDTERACITVSRGLLLPLTVERTVYRELSKKTVNLDFAEERSRIEEKLITSARARLAKEFVEQDSYCIVTEEIDRIRVTGVVLAQAVLSAMN